MKKRYIVIGVIFVIVLYFVVKGVNNTITINRLNNNSEFGLEVIQELTDDELSQYHIVEGFGEDIIYSNTFPAPFNEDIDEYEFDFHQYSEDNPFTYYSIASYPTAFHPYNHITQVTTTDPNNHIYGLHIGDPATPEIVKELFEDYNYKLDTSQVLDKEASFIYEKARLRIIIHTENNQLTEFTIYVRTTHMPWMIY